MVVVLSPHQNAFFGEIAAALVDELTVGGIDAAAVTEPDRHVVEPRDVFVLLPPHEYVVLEGPAFVDDARVAARTIGLSAEQPHQSFFARNAEVGARLGAVFDFSPLAVDAYRRLGVDAAHLRFGYTPGWDRRRSGPVASGPPRLLYLGNKRPRRLRHLAAAAPVLADAATRLLISDNDVPNLATGPTFVAGDDKRDLLASTRLLVNVHQSDEPYFEWLRFAEAAHCGTPVLSERSIETEPFVAGVHFEEFEGDGLGPAIDRLIGDDRRLGELADAAYDELRRHRFAASVDALVETARTLLDEPAPPALPARTRTASLAADRPVGPPVVAGRLGRSRPRWPRRERLTIVSTAADRHWVDELGGTVEAELVEVGAFDRAAARRVADGLVVFAPPGTSPYPSAFGELIDRAGRGREGVAHWSAVVDGLDADGEPTLEGIWPWEPWRLAAGQHLGRLVAVPAPVVRACSVWFARPELRSQAHVAVQWWIATRGASGEHLPFPVAHVGGDALDPSHAVAGDVVDAARRLVGLA